MAVGATDAAALAGFLKDETILRVLSRPAIEALCARSSLLRLPAEREIFFRGDVPDRVYIIISGEIAVETISEDGKAVLLATLVDGEILGEIAAIDGGARTANARSLTPAVVLSIRREDFLQLIADEPAFSIAIHKNLASRLRSTNIQVEAITLHSLCSRLANLLSTLAAGRDRVELTQSQIASRLSATREKVNVNLRKLQLAGAIELKRGAVEILDHARLRSFFADES